MSDDPRRQRLPAEDASALHEQEVTAGGQAGETGRRVPLHARILLGLALGALAGVLSSAVFGSDHPPLVAFVHQVTEPIGQLFLRLLLMVVIPLVFSALVVGVAGVGNIRALGRIGLKTVVYTLGISALSVVIGLGLVNLVKPGRHLSPSTAAGLEARYGVDAAARAQARQEAESIPPLQRAVETLIPTNPIAAVATETPNLLHLMFFALALGIASTVVPPATAAPLIAALESLFIISTKMIDGIMILAPYAVACLVFSATATFGLDLLGALGWYIATVMGGLLLHGVVVYSISVYFLSGLSPLEFFSRIKLAAVTAFSTSSSNATLPTALRVTEENLGVPKEISSFVLTVGATANQNGTALYEGVTIIFLAQLAGVDLSLAEQLGVAYLAILGGIGTAGVPGGSIPFVVVVLTSLGLNPTLIAIILGIDRLLDMCRTTLNVVGDITAATFIARSEGQSLLGQRRPARQP